MYSKKFISQLKNTYSFPATKTSPNNCCFKTTVLWYISTPCWQNWWTLNIVVPCVSTVPWSCEISEHPCLNCDRPEGENYERRDLFYRPANLWTRTRNSSPLPTVATGFHGSRKYEEVYIFLCTSYGPVFLNGIKSWLLLCSFFAQLRLVWRAGYVLGWMGEG